MAAERDRVALPDMARIGVSLEIAPRLEGS
jgi:hypothetical protein